MPKRYGAIAVREEEERLLDVAHCNHYSADRDRDDDDYSGGSSGSGGGNGRGSRENVSTRRRLRRSKARAKWKCLGLKSLFGLLLPSLVVLASLSLLFSYRLQHRLSDLSVELKSAEGDVAKLASDLAARTARLEEMNATLTNHSAVIRRFESSVSNSDVLQRLDEMEGRSEERERRVAQEMLKTTDEIRSVLDQTKDEIDSTVRNATDEINFQVSSVRSALSHYIRETQDQFSTENSFMIYQLAGTFTLLGCLISMWHMTSHLRNFHQPVVQRKVLAILWMCPIYSVTSWASLVAPTLEGYLAILKDLYEAYVIYQFLSFCVAVLGRGDREAVVDLLAGHADHLTPPWRCCGCFLPKKSDHDPESSSSEEERNRRLAEDVLLQCQVCAMQFVFLRPMLTAALFVLKKADYHGPLFGGGGESTGGILDYRSPQFYILILENVSVFLAFSGLLKFYHAVQEDLSWCRPFPKFLCIKGVVFMTFWQGIGLSLLATTTDVLSSGGEAVSIGDGNDEDQVETWAKQAQNFLICLEMLGFAVAHFYCFPVEEWEDGYRPVEDKSKFGDNMALGDFVHDLKTILRHNVKKKSTAKARNKPSDDSISTVLEEDEELGRTESDDGLRSLLENVEDLLESGSDDTSSSGENEKRKRDSPSPSNRGGAKTRAHGTGRKGIEESLQDMNAPKELRQATALLLAGTLLDEATARLLTSDIMALEAASHDDDSVDQAEGQRQVDEDVAGGKESKKSQEELDGCGEAVVADSLEGGERSAASDANAPAPEGVAQPSEPPPLPPVTENEDMLKPSIFTMHSTDGDEGAAGVESPKEDGSSTLTDTNVTTAEGGAQPSRESTSLWAGIND